MTALQALMLYFIVRLAYYNGGRIPTASELYQNYKTRITYRQARRYMTIFRKREYFSGKTMALDTTHIATTTEQGLFLSALYLLHIHQVDWPTLEQIKYEINWHKKEKCAEKMNMEKIALGLKNLGYLVYRLDAREVVKVYPTGKIPRHLPLIELLAHHS